jgi:hypothetical protein
MLAFLAHCLPFTAVAAQKTALVGREALQEHERMVHEQAPQELLRQVGRRKGEGVQGFGVVLRQRTLEHIFPNVSQSFCQNNLLQLLHAALFWSFALEPYELGINPSLYNVNLYSHN